VHSLPKKDIDSQPDESKEKPSDYVNIAEPSVEN